METYGQILYDQVVARVLPQQMERKEQSKPWDMMGIEGINKFLRKLWSLFYNEQEEWLVTTDEPKETSYKVLHATIKKTEEKTESSSFTLLKCDRSIIRSSEAKIKPRRSSAT